MLFRVETSKAWFGYLRDEKYCEEICFNKLSLNYITKTVYFILYERIIYEVQWLQIEVIDASVSTW